MLLGGMCWQNLDQWDPSPGLIAQQILRSGSAWIWCDEADNSRSSITLRRIQLRRGGAVQIDECHVIAVDRDSASAFEDRRE